jgi:hypothetical protein
VTRTLAAATVSLKLAETLVQLLTSVASLTGEVPVTIGSVWLPVAVLKTTSTQ